MVSSWQFWNGLLKVPNSAGDRVERLLLLVIDDLKQPDVLWQLGVIVLCVALAWWIARAVQARTTQPPEITEPALSAIEEPTEEPIARRLGVDGLKAVLWPLLATGFLLALRPILMNHARINLLSLGIALLGSLVVVRAAGYALRSAFPKSSLLASFERSVGVLVWGAFALHISGLTPELVTFLDGAAITLGNNRLSLLTVFSGVLWIVVIVLVALWLGAVIERRVMRTEGMHSSLRVVLSRLARALLVVVGVLIALPAIGVDLTVFSVFGGALGVGLGFGLQKIASNYMSGFIILLDRAVRLGDVVTVDHFLGEVKAITTRYTVVRAPDGREAIIPNEKLITDIVLNYSYSDTDVRLAVKVSVDYNCDLERALQVLVEAARTHPRVIESPPPAALVLDFGESGINLECGFWIREPQNSPLVVRSDISLMIWRRFRDEGIEIPFPRRDVRILEGAPPQGR